MSALWYGSYIFHLDLVTCCVVLVLCFLYAVPCGGSSIELTTSGSGPVGPGSAGRHTISFAYEVQWRHLDSHWIRLRARNFLTYFLNFLDFICKKEANDPL